MPAWVKASRPPTSMTLIVCGDLGNGGESAWASPTGPIARAPTTAAAPIFMRIPMTSSLEVVNLSYFSLFDRVSASVATGLPTVSAYHNALVLRDPSVLPDQSPAAIASGVAIQAPPTSGTLGSARYSAAFSPLTPPGGPKTVP